MTTGPKPKGCEESAVAQNSREEFAKAAQKLVADMISVPFQNAPKAQVLDGRWAPPAIRHVD